LLGRLEEAVEHYHNALGLKPEDTFSHEMIYKALEESYSGLGLGKLQKSRHHEMSMQ